MKTKLVIYNVFFSFDDDLQYFLGGFGNLCFSDVRSPISQMISPLLSVNTCCVFFVYSQISYRSYSHSTVCYPSCRKVEIYRLLLPVGRWGENWLFSIQSDTLRFFAWHEVTHMREDSYLDLSSFVHVVNAFFWQSERSLLLNVIQVFYVRNQQLFSVDDYHIVFVFQILPTPRSWLKRLSQMSSMALPWKPYLPNSLWSMNSGLGAFITDTLGIYITFL